MVVYEASQYPICEPSIICTSLSELVDADVSPIATLYVPPQEFSPIDTEMLTLLGISIDEMTIPAKLSNIKETQDIIS